MAPGAQAQGDEVTPGGATGGTHASPGAGRGWAATFGLAAALLAGSVLVESGAIPGIPPSLEGANRRFREGDFDGAARAYARILEDRPDDPRASYGLATALLAGGRGEEAVAPGVRATGAEVPGVRASAHYNLGWELLSRGVRPGSSALDRIDALEAAVRENREALRSDPGADDARWNLEIALRLLETIADSIEEAAGPTGEAPGRGGGGDVRGAATPDDARGVGTTVEAEVVAGSPTASAGDAPGVSGPSTTVESQAMARSAPAGAGDPRRAHGSLPVARAPAILGALRLEEAEALRSHLARLLGRPSASGETRRGPPW